MRAGWIRPSAINTCRARRDLAAIGIVGGDQDGFGRVVHDEVDPGVLLERPDVAPLAADDAPLHVVGGEVHHGDRGLHRVVRGEALDRRREDFLRLHLRGLARFLLETHPDQLSLAPRLDFHLREELTLGLFRREAGDRFELAPLLVQRDRESALLLADRLFAAGELTVLRAGLGESPLELVKLPRELLLLREDTLLDLLDPVLALSRLRFDGRARLQPGFLGLEVGALQAVRRVALGVLNDTLRATRRFPDLPIADPLCRMNPSTRASTAMSESRMSQMPCIAAV